MAITFYLLAVVLPFSAVAWPTGAPAKACESMMPKHGNNRPKPASQSPYVFTQSTDSYTSDDRILVQVQAPQSGAFKGLMVQAYDPRTNETIGDFLPGEGLKQIPECSSMSHSDNRDKKSAILIWQAPKSRGNVKFRATVVKQFNEFYHGLSASMIKA